MGKAEQAGVALCDLLPGTKARVVRARSPGAVRKKLVEMGVTRGTCVEVVRVAPLGDPVDIIVRDYHLSLRKAEAAGVLVEPCTE